MDTVDITVYERQRRIQKHDCLAEEVPVALVYNGLAHVVMMATPDTLEEFALGFSLSEGIVTHHNEVYGIEIVNEAQGISLHLEIANARFSQLKARRRQLAGRTGCGLCGTEQLSHVFRDLPILPVTQTLNRLHINHALHALQQAQPLSRKTGCAHAACWISSTGHLLHACEDIGRHVALDKLIGTCCQTPSWQQGAVLITSRASYEMVQKSIAVGIEILITLGAPTSLAVRMAKQHQLTLISFAKIDHFNLYSAPERLIVA